MNDTSGINPNSNNPIIPNNEPNPSNSNPVSFGNKNVPETFVQKCWHFNDAEAKKFLTTLANTIASQIQHENDEIKTQNNKLKEAETEGDME
ncbi:MAG: hypothetical protein WCG10_04895 [Chlamydiota bacterium]